MTRPAPAPAPAPDPDHNPLAPSEPTSTPEEVARVATAAVLDLHVTTSQLLPVTHLPQITQAVQNLIVLVSDITQDLHTLAANYSLDAGHLPHDRLDLRRQAGLTGSEAARAYTEGVELLHQASTRLTPARDHARLMAALTTANTPSTPDVTAGRTPASQPGSPPSDSQGPVRAPRKPERSGSRQESPNPPVRGDVSPGQGLVL
ncbi:hypothetical protein ACO229_06515 [Promicromonospora sp. MS192]|uniref:hypothetical protein n=1 Tax=Promicromonospora sp. MS192 TaxID=3412684 RepID=UPI003C303595